MWSGSFRWMNVPKAESFETTFGSAASRSMPARHSARPCADTSSMPPGVLQHAGDVRTRRLELRTRPPSASRRPEGRERQTVVRKPGYVALQNPVQGEVRARREAVHLVLVPVELHAVALAQERVLREPVELWPHVFGEQVGIADDGVRPAGLVGRPLHPRHFVGEPIRRPVGLHEGGARHRGARDVVEALVDEVVAPDPPRRGRRCGAASVRAATAGRPGARHAGGRRRSGSCSSRQLVATDWRTTGPNAPERVHAGGRAPPSTSRRAGRRATARWRRGPWFRAGSRDRPREV